MIVDEVAAVLFEALHIVRREEDAQLGRAQRVRRRAAVAVRIEQRERELCGEVAKLEREQRAEARAEVGDKRWEPRLGGRADGAACAAAELAEHDDGVLPSDWVHRLAAVQRTVRSLGPVVEELLRHAERSPEPVQLFRHAILHRNEKRRHLLRIRRGAPLRLLLLHLLLLRRLAPRRSAVERRDVAFKELRDEMQHPGAVAHAHSVRVRRNADDACPGKL